MNNNPLNHQATGFRPALTFCGDFSGKEGRISAARWLKRLEWELEPFQLYGHAFAGTFLRSVDLLLIGDAATWADTSEEVSYLLSMLQPSLEDVTRFKDLFQARFPSKSFEPTSTSDSFNKELHNLEQMKGEPLKDYYQRAIAVMHRAGASDRNSGSRPLTILESSMLDLIIGAFVHGLSDPDVSDKCTAKMGSPGRSLHEIYIVAEDAAMTKERRPTRWGPDLKPEPAVEPEPAGGWGPAGAWGSAEAWRPFGGIVPAKDLGAELFGGQNARQSGNNKYSKQWNRTRDEALSSMTEDGKNTPVSSLHTWVPPASAHAQQHRVPKQGWAENYGNSSPPESANVLW